MSAHRTVPVPVKLPETLMGLEGRPDGPGE